MEILKQVNASSNAKIQLILPIMPLVFVLLNALMEHFAIIIRLTMLLFVQFLALRGLEIIRHVFVLLLAR